MVVSVPAGLREPSRPLSHGASAYQGSGVARGPGGLGARRGAADPDAHHSLEPLSNLSLRAGWATSMARPYELLPTSTA